MTKWEYIQLADLHKRTVGYVEFTLNHQRVMILCEVVEVNIASRRIEIVPVASDNTCLWIDSSKIYSKFGRTRFHLVPDERNKECPYPHGFPYTGSMPCTGRRVCPMCGLTLEKAYPQDTPVDIKPTPQPTLSGTPNELDRSELKNCIHCKRALTTKAVGRDRERIPCSYYLPGGTDPTGVGPLCLRCYRQAIGF